MKTKLTILCLAFAVSINISTTISAQVATVQNENAVPTLRIVNLKAYQRGKQNTIKWTSINETNIDCYTIQRSSNGNEFSNIGVVSATGNGEQGAAYNFTDYNILIGNNYYRLKVSDKSGNISF